MQFVDAWTNNFAYLGRRATGTARRSPGWQLRDAAYQAGGVSQVED